MQEEYLPAKRELDIERFFQLALENNAVEALQKLLEMRADLKQEAAREDYFRAFTELQAALPIIGKGKEARDPATGSLQFRYAPMDIIIPVVKPLLQQYGFSWSASSSTNFQEDSVTVFITIRHIQGHTEIYPYTSAFLGGTRMMDRAKIVEGTTTLAIRKGFCQAFGIITGEEEIQSATVDLVNTTTLSKLVELLKVAKIGSNKVLERYKITELSELTQKDAELFIANLEKALKTPTGTPANRSKGN